MLWAFLRAVFLISWVVCTIPNGPWYYNMKVCSVRRCSFPSALIANFKAAWNDVVCKVRLVEWFSMKCQSVLGIGSTSTLSKLQGTEIWTQEILRFFKRWFYCPISWEGAPRSPGTQGNLYTEFKSWASLITGTPTTSNHWKWLWCMGLQVSHRSPVPMHLGISRGLLLCQWITSPLEPSLGMCSRLSSD